jgi:serine/threonine protein kinase
MERNSYKVIGKISDGGFGEIFKVKSLKSNELLALKHIKYRGSCSFLL